MSDVYVKRGDVGQVITGTLSDDLTSATSVLFLAKCGDTLISGTGDVTDAANGGVSYTTVAGDLATAGEFLQEWQVTFADGTVATYPSRSYNRLFVVADLNP